MGEQTTYSLSEAEQATSVHRLFHFDKAAFDALAASGDSPRERTELFAQMARFNTLYMIARAGSGHIGSSFSSLDIVSWLYLRVLTAKDRYFSSKGHDSPGLYAVHTALGILPYDKIHALRRRGGLPGHPDVGTPGAVTNTGSLGMGVSKAKGFLFADDLLERSPGRLFVLTGDGELQEGQFWESLATAARRTDGRLTVIVDHNKIQSDTYVADTSDLGDLESKFRAFGWEVHRCDGHDYVALERLLGSASSDGRPRAIIADTIKGRGVSFMEHTAMGAEHFYRFHSGAPSPQDYQRAVRELMGDIEQRSAKLGLPTPEPRAVEVEPLKVPATHERMIPAYSKAIVEQARNNPHLVALDADLILDTGLIPFQEQFPNRFVECGIAEQDMVSQAGAMALAGALPVVHSFACFLTTRPAEQIYNNCTEGKRVVYVGSLAGVLPGGPGHSHQSVRDITAMAAMPGMTLIEPANAAQVGEALAWATRVNPQSTYLRLTSIPYHVRPELSVNEPWVEGRGYLLRDGGDLTVTVTGPVLVSEVLAAADVVSKEGLQVRVISTPWLNRVDLDWYRTRLGAEETPLLTVENHYADHGFGAWFVTQLARAGLMKNRRVDTVGLWSLPACGRNDEVLRAHCLDSDSLAHEFRRIARLS